MAIEFFVVWTSGESAHAQDGAVRGVHDPCIIQAGERYVVFSTGPGIPVRHSEDLYHWERAGRVFESDPEWFSREVPGARGAWAPDIAFFNGAYHLYYSVSTFGSNRSCIGLATNRTLDPQDAEYNWVDHGPILRSTTRDDFNAIDPNVVVDAAQKPWLAFGSHWSGIKLTELNPGSGKPLDPGRLISLASRPGTTAIEAPFLVRRADCHFLFVSFDQCCQGVRSTYQVAVGRATALTGPYVDRAGNAMVQGGGTTVVASHGRVRGPGHCALLDQGDRQWLVHHFYDADNRGAPTLQIRPLHWGDDGFPVAGAPIEGPVSPLRSPAEREDRTRNPEE